MDNLIVNAKRNVSSSGILKLSLTEQKDGLHFSIYNEGRKISKEIWKKYGRSFTGIRTLLMEVPDWGLPLLHRSYLCRDYPMERRINRAA